MQEPLVPMVDSQENNGNKHTAPAPKAQLSRWKRNKHLQTEDFNAPMNNLPTICSKQPSHHQPANIVAGQGAQYSTTSTGTDTPSIASPYAYAGTASNTQTQPSPVQAACLLFNPIFGELPLCWIYLFHFVYEFGNQTL